MKKITSLTKPIRKINDLLKPVHCGDILILKVKTSEIDLTNVADVRKDINQIEDKDPKCAVIDLQDVTFLDASAIAWIISVQQQYKNKSRKLFIAGNEKVKEIFALTSTDKLIEIYDSIDDAVAKCA